MSRRLNRVSISVKLLRQVFEVGVLARQQRLLHVIGRHLPSRSVAERSSTEVLVVRVAAVRAVYHQVP